MTIFEAVKAEVTPRMAAERYGLHVGRSGMVQCLFHDDTTPSMKLYDDHYHCFGCQATGDVIHLTAKLFGVTDQEAANKLAADFGVQREKTSVLAKLSRFQEQAEQELVEESNSGELSADEKLYARLLSLMQEEELFKDPELSRDTLAARLGTNRTYLADSVKACAGQTLGDFINRHRLRWAAEALSRNEELSVSAVGEDAGFASRSTFNRLFQQQYGMSPGAYRTAARS